MALPADRYSFPSLGITLLIAGLVFFVAGISHRNTGVGRWDAGVFVKLYRWLAPAGRFFAYIWPLGTTPVALVMIALLFIPHPDGGWKATLAYLGITLLERLVKRRLQRPRPFQTLVDVTVDQPKLPGDASFPSGDAMRVWFIGLLLPIFFSLPGWAAALAAGMAFTLSLSRIALGVHYPLDVIAGSALGLIGAGLSLLLAGM